MTHLAEIKILIGTSSFAELDKTPLNRLKDTGCCIIDNPYKRKLTKLELMELLEDDVVGLIAGLEPLDREVMEKSQLKVISRCGSGMSNVDLDAANKLGVKVCSTPFGPTQAVAELTITCLLSLLREIPQVNESMHEKKWDKRIGLELCGKKVAIIGYGRIGQRTGKFLSAFDAKVIAVDPEYDDGCDNVMKMELDQALNMADVIILHSSGDKLLIGEREFAVLKQGVFILNAARGELIDEHALIDALNSGKVTGAWLDTYTEEPYCGSLCDYPQVILTPHIGSYTLECRKQMENEAVENLIAALAEDGE